MPRITERVGRTAGRVVEEVETRILVNEGRKSFRAKLETVKRVTKKAAKVGFITGVVAATAVVMHERRKRRKLSS